jgi:hypothetical protein
MIKEACQVASNIIQQKMFARGKFSGSMRIVGATKKEKGANDGLQHQSPARIPLRQARQESRQEACQVGEQAYQGAPIEKFLRREKFLIG